MGWAAQQLRLNIRIFLIFDHNNYRLLYCLSKGKQKIASFKKVKDDYEKLKVDCRHLKEKKKKKQRFIKIFVLSSLLFDSLHSDNSKQCNVLPFGEPNHSLEILLFNNNYPSKKISLKYLQTDQ